MRFNRHAVYLGVPAPVESCPAGAVAGRTEAILVVPIDALARSGTYLPAGSTVRILDRRIGVAIIASWHNDPSTIVRSLRLRSVAALRATASSEVAAVVRAATIRREAGVRHASQSGGQVTGTETATTSTSTSTTPATTTQTTTTTTTTTTKADTGSTAGQVYSGLGFDACSTPSTSVMATWRRSSPYRAIGVYIGGTNSACAQGNLTSSWVKTESAAGWRLIPIYVGLQAPETSCDCATITPSKAAAEGAADATDAVADAQTLGLGPGNPIFDDMEAYTVNSRDTAPVLAFLAAWTKGLHAAGYVSGVYSSDDSGISDLVASYGTGYTEPDEIWPAAWNGKATTSDSVIPASDWANHQRIHQYEGGFDATYGGDTINIDADALDAATAAPGAATAVSAAPVATTAPTVTGTPVAGLTLSEQHAAYHPAASGYTYQWELCDAGGGNCFPVAGATKATIVIPTADVGATLRVQESATNAAGTSTPVVSAATAPVDRSVAGYWVFTSGGVVANTTYEQTFGSPALSGVRGASFTGMAVADRGLGYWLVSKWGHVYGYGAARSYPLIHIAHPARGIVASPRGGYWIYTANGNVYASRHTPFYGSLARRHVSDVTGMATTMRGYGYWLATVRGTVVAFGSAAKRPAIRHISGAVIGIVSAPDGYWLYTSNGNVYGSTHTRWYGSPAHSGVKRATFTGMIATPDKRGYWLVTSTGAVYGYGDATSYAAPDPSGTVAGIAGR